MSAESGKTLWHGRFEGGPAEELLAYTVSLPFDQRLWPDDVFVDFENNLNTAVARLREALNDSAEGPRFIETLPRHGYRFIGILSRESVPAPGSVGAKSASRGASSAVPESGCVNRALTIAVGSPIIAGLLLRQEW